MIEFFVAGDPIPQGSKTAGLVRGRPFVRDANAAELHPWRDRVRERAAGRLDTPYDGPVLAWLSFQLAPPGYVKPPRRYFPSKRQSGDLDKLVRAIFDAVTGPIVVDDSQFVGLLTTKQWGPPGVNIRVAPLLQDDDGLGPVWPAQWWAS